MDFVGKVMSLLFNMLSRLVITFLPKNKRLLISWLQSPSAVILEPKKIKSDTVSTVSHYFQEVMGPDAMIFVSWMLSFKPTFSLSSFTFINRLLLPSEAKGSSWEELPNAWGRGAGRVEHPHVQGAVVAQVQEGQEELLHIKHQEGRQWGDTPHPR